MSGNDRRATRASRVTPTERVFGRIYRDNAWNGDETRSGPGSGTEATRNLWPELLDLIADLGVRSVLDVGCGEGSWMPDAPRYLGVDVTREAIDRARVRHPGRAFMVADLSTAAARVPAHDLVIVRDVIQHLPFGAALDLLEGVRSTGSRWLLASSYRGGVNVDVPAGACYEPDMEAAPFALGPPTRLLIDGYAYHDGDAIRDPRKILGLWPL